MDRDIRDPIELLDEIEDVLKIQGAPINWPIGMGKEFKGVYNLYTDVPFTAIHQDRAASCPDDVRIEGLESDAARALLGDEYEDFLKRLNWCAAPAMSLTWSLSWRAN